MRILPIRNENPVKITTVLRNGRRANDGISIVYNLKLLRHFFQCRVIVFDLIESFVVTFIHLMVPLNEKNIPSNNSRKSN